MSMSRSQSRSRRHGSSIPSGPRGAERSTPAGASTLCAPDILHATPKNCIDREQISPSLAIAFTTGGTPGVLEELPLLPSPRPHGWQASCFTQDLFLDSLVSWLADFELQGQKLPADPPALFELLTRPVNDTDLAFRHAIFREIRSSTKRRAELEQCFVAVERVRGLLTAAHSDRGNQVQDRRIEMLKAIRTAVDTLAARFEGCTNGLERVRQFGTQAAASSGFRRLVDLLEYESKHTTIDIRLGLGSDGAIREFDLVRIDERKSNPFWASPIVRFFRKIVMWLRGYGFSELEVLSRAMDAVFADVEEIVVRLFELQGDMAFYLAGLRLSDASESFGLKMCLPVFQTDGERRYEDLFNPLLVASGTRPLSSTIAVEAARRIAVVTGPNSGGKTRFLEALGIAQMLGEAGFLVPASSATLVRTNGMFASMQVEFGLSHPEGHLGTELLRVREAFEKLPRGGFVLLDELCSGTNPAEAHELIELVVEMLDHLGMQAFISTHFLDLASKLQREQGDRMAFLQVEVDEERRPTFRVIPGVAVSSLARETATRLGVTRAELLALSTK